MLIYQAPNTSKKHPQHKIYPYLRAFEAGSDAKKEIGIWLTYYNTERSPLLTAYWRPARLMTKNQSQREKQLNNENRFILFMLLTGQNNGTTSKFGLVKTILDNKWSPLGTATGTKLQRGAGAVSPNRLTFGRRHRAEGEATPNGKVRFARKSGPDGREKLGSGLID